MKRMTCELCGSTNFVKQDGMFVCQDCGCKYTVEEARKLMVEVDGPAPSATPSAAPAVAPAPNNTQLESLLNMAQISFDSKNYEKAEEFCNQVIAMDNNNYTAWKLKGEAINYQISSNNQRILEVYNCIMNSYRVLDDAGKEEKKHEIIASLKKCFESEITFWISEFESKRPTKAALGRVESAYSDSYAKLKAAFEELGLEDEKEEYLIKFDNYFIEHCSAICNSAWKTTVGYNYYRDYFGKGIDPFGRTDRRYVITNTDLWRPMNKTWDTFMDETDNLISLLQFAEKRFNDDTNPQVMSAIYANIAFFEECVIPSGSWKISTGYAHAFDEYKSVGWAEEYFLTEGAKTIRRVIMNDYRKKHDTLPAQIEAKQKAKREQKKQERIAKYWEEHSEEKAKLDSEKDELEKRMEELNTQIAELDKANAPRIAELEKKRSEKTDADTEVENQERVIREVETLRDGLSIFKGKEKKALIERLEKTERPLLKELKEKAKTARQALDNEVSRKILEIRNEGKEMRDEVASLKKKVAEIVNELTKDRE